MFKSKKHILEKLAKEGWLDVQPPKEVMLNDLNDANIAELCLYGSTVIGDNDGGLWRVSMNINKNRNRLTKDDINIDFLCLKDL